MAFVALTLLCLQLGVYELTEAMSCSSCNSMSNPYCESNPPSPILCNDPGSAVTLTCIIIREYNNRNEQTAFYRDCSTVQRDLCYAIEGNSTRCVDVCSEEACNYVSAAVTSRPHVIITSISALALVFLLL